MEENCFIVQNFMFSAGINRRPYPLTGTVITTTLRVKCSVADPVNFFSGSGSADPVFKIRIRIRVTPKRPDPTGSESGSYLEMFLIFSKIYIKFMAFLYQI